MSAIGAHLIDHVFPYLTLRQHGHIEACDANDMAAYAQCGGFSVDAGMCIEAPDRTGLDQLLRYCPHWPWTGSCSAELICQHCSGSMCIIAFSADIRKIVEYIGVDPEASLITPTRGPLLRDDCGAQEQGKAVDT